MRDTTNPYRPILTPEEFYRPPAPTPGASGERHNKLRQDEIRRKAQGTYHKDRWYGADWKTIESMPNAGWREGVEQAMRLLDDPSMPTAGVTKRRTRWNYDRGDTIDVHRLYAGMPFYRQRKKQVGGQGGRYARIVLHGGANCFVTADQIAWRTYTAIRACDALEAAGFRAELSMVWVSKRLTDADPGYFRGVVRIKEAQDPLDISQLAALLSPAAFRYYGFLWYCSVPHRVNYGLGRSEDDAESRDDEGVVYLAESVRSEKDAKAWLEDLARRFEDD